jgi:hypothetical protein
MHLVLAACYPPYIPSRHEIFPVVELAHHVHHAVRENGHLECPALQLVHNMTRESRDCRERIVNVCEVKMVRQNRELVIVDECRVLRSSHANLASRCEPSTSEVSRCQQHRNCVHFVG